MARTGRAAVRQRAQGLDLRDGRSSLFWHPWNHTPAVLQVKAAQLNGDDPDVQADVGEAWERNAASFVRKKNVFVGVAAPKKIRSKKGCSHGY